MWNLLKSSNRIMLLVSLSILAMITTSCQDLKLKAVIRSANKQCPIDIDGFGKITSIAYDGQNVVYTFNVDETYTNIKTLKEHPENLKSSMAIMLQNPTKDAKVLLHLVIKCNAGLKMIYVGKDSGDQVEGELSTEELNEILNTDISLLQSDLTKLETQIKIANLQFPLKAREGITVEKMLLNNESVIYLCRLDEDMYDINLIKENHNTVKQGIIEELSGESQPMQLFIKYCVNCNRNIVYRYIGNQSETQYDVIATAHELKEILKDK